MICQVGKPINISYVLNSIKGFEKYIRRVVIKRKIEQIQGIYKRRLQQGIDTRKRKYVAHRGK